MEGASGDGVMLLPALLFVRCLNTSKEGGAVGYMPFKLFRRVIDQLVGRDIARLSLHLAGEPLLHPQIIDMVRYAKRKRYAACQVRHKCHAAG